MNQARIDLALVLSHLGVPFELDSFSKRLNLQKKIYIAQLTGADLGYRYSWYLRGPYSTNLTADAFTLCDDIRSEDTDYRDFTLHEQTIQQLDLAKTVWEQPAEFDGSQDDWLELLASLHYLRHIAYRPKGAERDFEECFQKLVDSKPRFSTMKAQAEIAWNRLDDFGLIDRKSLE